MKRKSDDRQMVLPLELMAIVEPPKYVRKRKKRIRRKIAIIKRIKVKSFLEIL